MYGTASCDLSSDSVRLSALFSSGFAECGASALSSWKATMHQFAERKLLGFTAIALHGAHPRVLSFSKQALLIATGSLS